MFMCGDVSVYVGVGVFMWGDVSVYVWRCECLCVEM